MGLDVIQAYKNNPATPKIPIPSALAVLIQMANGDPEKELNSIEKFYNHTMDQAASLQRRNLQLITLLVAWIFVVGLNLDTISFISTLLGSTAHIQVLGWSPSSLPTDSTGWILKIVGLLVTTLFVSLGAPFWFNVLYKLIPLKSS